VRSFTLFRLLADSLCVVRSLIRSFAVYVVAVTVRSLPLFCILRICCVCCVACVAGLLRLRYPLPFRDYPVCYVSLFFVLTWFGFFVVVFDFVRSLFVRSLLVMFGFGSVCSSWFFICCWLFVVRCSVVRCVALDLRLPFQLCCLRFSFRVSLPSVALPVTTLVVPRFLLLFIVVPVPLFVRVRFCRVAVVVYLPLRVFCFGSVYAFVWFRLPRITARRQLRFAFCLRVSGCCFVVVPLRSIVVRLDV